MCFPVLQQIDYLISQYATARNKVIYDLDSKWTGSPPVRPTSASRQHHILFWLPIFFTSSHVLSQLMCGINGPRYLQLWLLSMTPQFSFLCSSFLEASQRVDSWKAALGSMYNNEGGPDIDAVILCSSDSLPLPDIGPLLGGRIHDQLDKEVRPALDRVLNMAGGTWWFFSFCFLSFPALLWSKSDIEGGRAGGAETSKHPSFPLWPD